MTQPLEAPMTTEFTRYKPEECPVTTKPSPVKAIRMKCLECSGGAYSEVTNCWATKCPLYVYRFGRNPFRTQVIREYTEEERAAIRERLLKNRTVLPTDADLDLPEDELDDPEED